MTPEHKFATTAWPCSVDFFTSTSEVTFRSKGPKVKVLLWYFIIFTAVSVTTRPPRPQRVKPLAANSLKPVQWSSLGVD